MFCIEKASVARRVAPSIAIPFEDSYMCFQTGLLPSNQYTRGANKDFAGQLPFSHATFMILGEDGIPD